MSRAFWRTPTSRSCWPERPGECHGKCRCRALHRVRLSRPSCLREWLLVAGSRLCRCRRCLQRVQGSSASLGGWSAVGPGSNPALRCFQADRPDPHARPSARSGVGASAVSVWALWTAACAAAAGRCWAGRVERGRNVRGWDAAVRAVERLGRCCGRDRAAGRASGVLLPRTRNLCLVGLARCAVDAVDLGDASSLSARMVIDYRYRINTWVCCHNPSLKRPWRRFFLGNRLLR